MNMISWWLLTVGFLSIIGVLFRFQKRKRRMSEAHGLRVGMYSAQITLHQQQITLRDVQLSGYDFQKYNLKEVLLPNPDIIT